ncbi:tetratricopeptide repeat protein [Chelatococcus asaccharovorans]|uniref:tetratricopeptide repeat protein n=1 Tax=Chelatococcus asaccharovorans TaxID=28210 RepID=UPI00224C71A1|nr:tetratricopeptide repeat protein [Chelatococcus asaccharovorans]CAH1656283.1 TPR repeat protein [Chelatococcus asaccharovorans]CAH1685161.1 TPR repeat protein [Chelatococcus asaccharovorans]
MTQNVPWSVKGIDPQAREAAKDAARKAGMTLGAWLNSMIAETTQPGGGGGLHRFSFDSESQDIFADAADRLSRETAALKAQAAAPQEGAQRSPGDLENLLESVAKRLDAMEARLDSEQASQPMLSVVEKLEQRLESLTAAVQPSGATAAEDMLRTLETRLTDIIVRLGPDASAAIAPRREAARHVDDGFSESGDQQEPAASPRKAMSLRGATPFHDPITRPGGGDTDSDRFAATIAEIRRRQARLSEEGERDIADTLATTRADTLADTEDAAMDDTDKARPAHGATGSASGPATSSDQAVASGHTADFTERLETLTEKIDALLVPGRFPALDGVIERLDRIDAHIAHPKRPVDVERVEQLLAAVAARLESDQGNALDPESLDALETQIAHLARRVDEALRSKPTDATLDKKLADLEALMIGLVDRAQGMQKDAIQSVEFATRTAVTEALGAKIWDGTGDMNGLKADIADLKSVHSAASERTQDTLRAVHQTLELVVQRLALMESERALGRKPDLSRALFETQAAQILATDREAIPATAASRHAEPARAAGAETAPTATPDVKSSFIAAARRAAQTATLEMAGPAAAPGVSPEQTASGRPAPAPAKADAATMVRGRGESLIERLRHGTTRRRNVVFGIAALVIAIGAAQLIVSYGRLSNDGTAPPAMGQHGAVSREPAADMSGLALAQPQSALPSPLALQPSAHGTTPNAPDTQITDAAGSGPVHPLVLSDFANPLAQPPEPPAASADAAMTTGSIKPLPEALAPKTKAAALDAAPESAKPREMTTTLPKGMLAGIPASIGTEALRQAAEKGNAAAVYELASRLAEGRGMPRDMKMAARLFEAQAEAGFAPAQYRIANHYEKGFGVDRDLAKAREWYQRAAEAGNAKAMHNLAVLYAEGVSGKPDYPTAVKWFRKAAELGVRDSQFNLAILAARGLGMEADLAQSYTWFAILAENGDADAAEKRDSVGARLSPTDLTLARAAADQWVVKTPDPAANTVEVSPEWNKPSVPRGTTGDASTGGKTKSRG